MSRAGDQASGHLQTVRRDSSLAPKVLQGFRSIAFQRQGRSPSPPQCCLFILCSTSVGTSPEWGKMLMSIQTPKSVHSKWIGLRLKPDPLWGLGHIVVPRMHWHNAIEAWERMEKAAWKRCSLGGAPARGDCINVIKGRACL